MEPRIELATARGSRRGTAVSLALHALAAFVLLLAPAESRRSERSATPPPRVVVLAGPARRQAPAPLRRAVAGARANTRSFPIRAQSKNTVAPGPLAGSWEDPPVPQIAVPAALSRSDAARLPEPGPRFGDTRVAAASARSAPEAARSGFAAVAASRPAIKLAAEGAAGGFATARTADPASRSGSEPPPAPMTRPVEILAKPVPRYTESARARGIEGEVWIEAFFPSEGAAQALRVLRGLGHGLDEEARRCVAQVRFRPAERDGLRIGAVATLRITFELADSPLEKSGGAGNGVARSNP